MFVRLAFVEHRTEAKGGSHHSNSMTPSSTSNSNKEADFDVELTNKEEKRDWHLFKEGRNPFCSVLVKQLRLLLLKLQFGRCWLKLAGIWHGIGCSVQFKMRLLRRVGM